jgi:hypothetical protein
MHEYWTLNAVVGDDRSKIDYGKLNIAVMDFNPKLTIMDVVEGVHRATGELRNHAIAQRSVNDKAIEMLETALDLLEDPTNHDAPWLSGSGSLFDLLGRARALVIRHDTGFEILTDGHHGDTENEELDTMRLKNRYSAPHMRGIDALRSTVPHTPSFDDGWYGGADAALEQGQQHAIEMVGSSIREAIGSIARESERLLSDTVLEVPTRTLSEYVRDRLWMLRHPGGFPAAREAGIRYKLTVAPTWNPLDAGYQYTETPEQALDQAEHDVWTDGADGVLFMVEQDEDGHDDGSPRRGKIHYSRIGQDVVDVRITGGANCGLDHVWRRGESQPLEFRSAAIATLTGKQVTVSSLAV